MPPLLKLLPLLAVACLLQANPDSCRAEHVNWTTDIETALRSASASQRLVLMKFTADWCVYCKKMEHETFTQPAVAQLVNQQFVPVLIDADKHQDLVKHLKIKGLPALLIVSPKMVILSRIRGYQTEDQLLPQLQAAVAQYSPSGLPGAAMADLGNSTLTRSVSRPASEGTPLVPATQQKSIASRPSFGGLCLPAVSETRSLVSGRPEFAIVYRSRTLYFSSEEFRNKFRTAPAKYWPAVDGACPVTLAESGQRVEGKLEYGAMFRGRLWTTTSADAMQKFVAEPAKYVDALANLGK